MNPAWTWFEWTWLAALFESVVGPVVLTAGCLAVWRRTRSRLLGWATVGFALAVLGGGYHTYAFMYAGAICGSGPSNIADIQRFAECSNVHGAYGNAVAAAGMLASGVLLLIYALRR
jgi:hypothetical protein